jgi:hypothetical protein
MSYLQSNSPIGILRIQAYNLRGLEDSHLVLTFQGNFSQNLGVS